MLGRAWAGPGPVLGLGRSWAGLQMGLGPGRSWVYKMAQLEPVYTIKPNPGPRYFTTGPGLGRPMPGLGRAGLGWPDPLDIFI